MKKFFAIMIATCLAASAQAQIRVEADSFWLLGQKNSRRQA
jgi:hypothetical protein